MPVMECSVCQTPAVLRWSFVFGRAGGDGNELMYQRDCKHRSGSLGPRLAGEGERSIDYTQDGTVIACATVPFILPDDALEPA